MEQKNLYTLRDVCNGTKDCTASQRGYPKHHCLEVLRSSTSRTYCFLVEGINVGAMQRITQVHRGDLARYVCVCYF